MKENRSEFYQNELGINFPQQVDPQLMMRIVEASQFSSLRELIARHVISEGQTLWNRIKPIGYDTDPGTRSAEDIAINEGYCRCANMVLVASSYYYDQASAVETQARSIEILDAYIANPTYDIDRISDTAEQLRRQSPLYANIRRDLKEEMARALESLAIDPTGIDWLMQKLRTQEIVWNGIHKDSLQFNTTEDPQVIGFRIAINRYKQLYDQALKAGAIKDKTVSRRKQISTKLTRGVKTTAANIGFGALIGVSRALERRKQK